MFNPEHCSPSNDKKISCITLKLLRKIARIIKNKVGEPIKISSGKKELYDNISTIMSKLSKCSSERCWVKVDIIRDNLTEKEYKLFINNFRPLRPKEWDEEPNKWLSTLDINNVMEQYDEAYPRFRYIGAIPIDYDYKINNKCVSEELCSINMDDLNKDKISSIGIIFNTDKHNGGGEHWFCIYIDIRGNNGNNPTIYHFDSLANDPSPDIIDLINKLKIQCKKKGGGEIDVIFNDIKHQEGNTECGIYSLHFLTSMLKGVNFNDYIQSIKSDKYMERFRDVFFIDDK